MRNHFVGSRKLCLICGIVAFSFGRIWILWVCWMYFLLRLEIYLVRSVMVSASYKAQYLLFSIRERYLRRFKRWFFISNILIRWDFQSWMLTQTATRYFSAREIRSNGNQFLPIKVSRSSQSYHLHDYWRTRKKRQEGTRKKSVDISRDGLRFKFQSSPVKTPSTSTSITYLVAHLWNHKLNILSHHKFHFSTGQTGQKSQPHKGIELHTENSTILIALYYEGEPSGVGSIEGTEYR